MKGKNEARTRDMERDVSLAWYSAAFAGAKKLKPLKTYLASIRTTEDQSRGAAALLGALKAMKSKGIPMDIKRLH